MADKKKLDKSFFAHQINNEKYIIEIYFYNLIEDPVPIPAFIVDSLTINETLINWWVTGNIVLNNTFEITQRDFLNNNNKKTKHLYIDRNDGRNKIHIRIIPVDENDDEFKDKLKWEMSYDLVIYDVEDLPSDNMQNKLKRYYFVDERYQIFLEKNIEWSTTYAALNMEGTTIKREDIERDESLRNLSANVALFELIKFASQNNEKSITVGFTEESSIEKPNIKLGDIYNWNLGPKDAVNKFYVSPAQFNVIDDINFLLSRCVGDNNDPVFLEFGRSSVNKYFELISLTEILENSNKQIERLILDENSANNDNILPYVPRAYLDENKDEEEGNNLISGYSRISNYKFSPMAPVDDTSRMINSPLHYFDTINGQFNIVFEPNSIQNTIKKIEEMSKATLYNFTPQNVNNKPHILTNINKTKSSGLMINNKFSADPYIDENVPSIQMIRDFLFLNQTLSFQQKGLTCRTPGKFIFVDSINSGDLNPFNDRFLGQWLITSVTHLFTKNDYKTEVVANKIDTFSKLWDIEDKNY